LFNNFHGWIIAILSHSDRQCRGPSEELFVWVLLFLLVSCCRVSMGEDFFWDGEGSDDRWLTGQNWRGDAVPGPSDRVILDESGGNILIGPGDVVSCRKILGPSWNSTGTTAVTIQRGTVNNPSYWYVGQLNGGTGILNILDGNISTRDLGMGCGGSAILNMIGGTLSVWGTTSNGLLIPCNSAGTATVNLCRGTIQACKFSMAEGGLIDIADGQLILDGNQESKINSYLNNGWIVAFGGKGTVKSKFDTDSNSTIISAEFVNSLGMKFVQINPGNFMMGSDKSNAEPDEKPVHKVNITTRFYMSVTEVTNAQFEQFDSAHRQTRGKMGFSTEDDEAVIFVDWNQAQAFCDWLSTKEGLFYRLPTEAEWEYACRAGTTTAYNTGDTLPEIYWKNQVTDWLQKPVSLKVGATPPNPWGLYDMHGNVEEWCYDWYGPYTRTQKIDPLGRVSGLYKVTRGGSHGTKVFFLRSANRSATIPEDKSWMIGFRVVVGELPQTQSLPEPEPPLNRRNVSQEVFDWSSAPEIRGPYFEGPIPFVKPPLREAGCPSAWPNSHASSIVWCSNGDLIVTWVTNFYWREIYICASRLRRGEKDWEPGSVFSYVPDRDGEGGVIFRYGTNKLLFIRGLSASAKWATHAAFIIESRDNGATWSKPRLIYPEHGDGHYYGAHWAFTTKHRKLIVAGDACYDINVTTPGSFVHISEDAGQTWINPGFGQPEPTIIPGATGGWIAGIHAGVVELSDGRLMALGRKSNINGMMPRSISNDMGQTWTYSQSDFTGLHGGQRPILMRLNEGPIMLISFSNSGMVVTDAIGNPRLVYGMFGAVSYDEGVTWPVRKIITKGNPPREYDGRGRTGLFVMDDTHAEPAGYLGCTQTPDNLIHLVSSGLYYCFNLAWLEEPMTLGDVDDMEFYSPGGAEDIQHNWEQSGGAQMDISTEVVHWGEQSMKFEYDNRILPVSKVSKTFEPPHNWSDFGIMSLDMWFYGTKDNDVNEPLALILSDAQGYSDVLRYNEPNNLAREAWQLWRMNVDNSTVDLKAIKSVTLCIGDDTTSSTGKGTGTLYFDDIRVFGKRCLFREKVKTDLNGDCVVDFEDFGILTGSWLNEGLLWPGNRDSSER